MGDHKSPLTQIPPSTHHHHHNNSKSDNISVLCYALVIMGTASVVLAVFNLLIVKWCVQRRRSPAGEGAAEQGATSTSRSFENPHLNLLSTFEYRKKESDAVAAQEQECVVCLSAFEEGEEVRQLPSCQHSFHAPCIDMWLSSHSDCPLCRTPVRPPPREMTASTTFTSESSREGLLDSGIVP